MNVENNSIKLVIPQEKHEKLVETITRANALTQVILGMSIENLELIPPGALYHFLMTFNGGCPLH